MLLLLGGEESSLQTTPLLFLLTLVVVLHYGFYYSSIRNNKNGRTMSAYIHMIYIYDFYLVVHFSGFDCLPALCIVSLYMCTDIYFFTVIATVKVSGRFDARKNVKHR